MFCIFKTNAGRGRLSTDYCSWSKALFHLNQVTHKLVITTPLTSIVTSEDVKFQ